MELYNKYLNNTIRFLKFRGRSEKEIRDYLHVKKAEPDIIEKIISYCKDLKFIDDEKFAADWVRSRSTYRLKSKKIIKIELIKKGIDPEIIEKALVGLRTNESTSTDLDLAKKLVQIRINRYINAPRQEIYQKLGGFMARRGFGWDTIKQAIDSELALEYNKQNRQ
jgi:regulatory protein